MPRSFRQKSVRLTALEVIEHYFGKNTARIYDQYYKNQDEKKILKSMKELLNEFLGEEKTQQVLSEIQALPPKR